MEATVRKTYRRRTVEFILWIRQQLRVAQALADEGNAPRDRIQTVDYYKSLLHEQFLQELDNIEAKNYSPSERMESFIGLYEYWIDDVVRTAGNAADDQEPLPLMS